MSEQLVDDLDATVTAAMRTLRDAAGLDWHVPTKDLSWTCWETLEHVADDLFAYAGQIVVRRALDRLFPDAPSGRAPWPTLLWATGRAALGERERLTAWRWDGSVRT